MVCVSNQENSDLSQSVSPMEVQEALWSLKEDKVQGLDSFPPLFFHRYWSIIRKEVMEMVQAIFIYGIPSERKKTLITLVPKKPGTSMPSHFRSISLCTPLYKIYARVLVRQL